MRAHPGLRWRCGAVIVALLAGSLSAALAQDLTPIRPQPGAPPSVPLAGANPELPRTPVLQDPGLVVSSAPTYRITLRSGVATAITLGRVMKSVHIGDPKIVDFVPENDRTALLVPKSVGSTNIEILDDKLQLINSLDIQVDSFPATYQSVVVHNKALLSSQTNYRCAPDDCQYTGEITVEEPAPLPKGHSDTAYTGLVPAAGGAPPNVSLPAH